MTPIPFGPDYKDPPWRWGSYAMGIVGLCLLVWVMTLFAFLPLGWGRLILLAVIALLLSARAGRRWTLGRVPERSFSREVQPTVAIDGKPGATYVLVEPTKAGKSGKVKPRDFGPVMWSLYSIVVRAPIALGDYLLTVIWRLAAGRWHSSGIVARRTAAAEDFDFAAELPPPDEQTF